MVRHFLGLMRSTNFIFAYFQGRRKEFRGTSTPVSPEMLTGLPWTATSTCRASRYFEDVVLGDCDWCWRNSETKVNQSDFKEMKIFLFSKVASGNPLMQYIMCCTIPTQLQPQLLCSGWKKTLFSLWLICHKFPHTTTIPYDYCQYHTTTIPLLPISCKKTTLSKYNLHGGQQRPSRNKWTTWLFNVTLFVSLSLSMSS